MNRVTDTLIWAEFTSKKIKAHLYYGIVCRYLCHFLLWMRFPYIHLDYGIVCIYLVLSLSAMYEIPVYSFRLRYSVHIPLVLSLAAMDEIPVYSFRLRHSLHIPLVLSLSAMDKAPAYIADQLISERNPIQRMPGQFVNKTSNFSKQKFELFNYYHFSFHTNIISWICIEQPHIIL